MPLLPVVYGLLLKGILVISVLCFVLSGYSFAQRYQKMHKDKAMLAICIMSVLMICIILYLIKFHVDGMEELYMNIPPNA